MGERLANLRDILHPSVRWLVVIPVSALTVWQLGRAELLPSETADRFRLPALLDWPWYAYALLALLFLLGLVLESAHRLIQRREREAEERAEARVRAEIGAQVQPQGALFDLTGVSNASVRNVRVQDIEGSLFRITGGSDHRIDGVDVRDQRASRNAGGGVPASDRKKPQGE